MRKTDSCDIYEDIDEMLNYNECRLAEIKQEQYGITDLDELRGTLFSQCFIEGRINALEMLSMRIGKENVK